MANGATGQQDPTLDGVWEKFRRAEHHLGQLDRDLQAFIESDPQPVALSVAHFDPATGWHICYAVVRDPPPLRFGVVLGDFLHNARSALDHLVWQLVLLNGETPRAGNHGNAWPYALREEAWNSLAGSRLRGVGAAHVAVIEKVQPYRAGEESEATVSAVLRSLSDIDKHQVVHPSAAVLVDPGEGLDSWVIDGPGKIVRQQFKPVGLFENGEELVRVRVEPFPEETQVEVGGVLNVDVAFGESRVLSHVAKLILESVREVVAAFENDFR